MFKSTENEREASPEMETPPKQKRKPFNHTVFTAYGSLIISLFALILSCISVRQTLISENREIIQVLDADYGETYHYVGKELFVNYRITIANNSAIPVSITKMRIKDKIGGTPVFYHYGYDNMPDIFPINMEIGQTQMIILPKRIDFRFNKDWETVTRELLKNRGVGLDDECFFSKFEVMDVVCPYQAFEVLDAKISIRVFSSRGNEHSYSIEYHDYEINQKVSDWYNSLS